MSVLFLGIAGPGPWSLDALLAGRRRASARAAVALPKRNPDRDELRLAR